ncbi:hypothetical protein [Burkholderia contaminans]|uniref:hypothetical protein n=1 Tax=Burkholderia contaminans TaxID=488447 RepID=UPI00158E5808|nr:hypothetical protein [Burkholderia contaminans]
MAQINYGNFSGVSVHELDDKVVVEVNRHIAKMASVFKGKVQGGFYSSYMNDPQVAEQLGVDLKKNTMLAIPKEYLKSDEQIRDFNSRVNTAVGIHDQMQKDFEDIHSIVKFDLGGEKSVIPRYGQDSGKEPGTKKDWAYGEVVDKNKSYVAFKAGETADAVFVRILPTEKFLLSKEEENNAEQILNERLMNGEYKRLSWKSEDGKGTKIHVEAAERKQAKSAEDAKQEARKESIDQTNQEKKEVAKEQEASAQPAKKTTKKKQAAVAA